MKKIILPMIFAIISSPVMAQSMNHDHSNMSHDMSSMNMDIVTNPADGAVLPRSPRILQIDFGHPMLLQTVSIKKADGQAIPASFRRANVAVSQYSIALPVLANGTYNVRISARGMGHDMIKNISFKVGN